MPGKNTLKILNERKEYIQKKINDNLAGDKEAGSSRYSYLNQEIMALEKTINFIEWLINNQEDAMVNNIIEKYKKEKGIFDGIGDIL